MAWHLCEAPPWDIQTFQTKVITMFQESSEKQIVYLMYILQINVKRHK